MKLGKVFLVGAGPGDPGLITLKGMECIKNADVLIYDYLASPILLKYASPHTEIVYVGKKGCDHTLSQEKINALLIEKASNGLTVTRLKGGDPFIFARGAEEAEELACAGIDFEIVPGVTSAIAAPAYAGIPLTHRRFTSTLAVVTGHEDPTKRESGINWAALAGGMGTIVFLMGIKNLPQITHQLIHHGLSKDTPVALIRWGTTPSQTTVVGTLNTIVDQVTEARLKPPVVIVVGEVVTLRDRLKWFENRPLRGKRIVVTRAREQASALANRLYDLGAQCLEFPTIEVIPPADWGPLDRAIDALSNYDWLIFTSVNGVTFFFDRLFLKNKDVRSLGGIRVASIGPATAEKLFAFGIKNDIIPDSYQAESLVESFKKESLKQKKVLLPRAEAARPVLPVELRRMGAQVDEIVAYRTQSVQNNREVLLRHLGEKTIDLVIFTSSSTVKNFKSLLPTDKASSLMEGISIASIGPITTDTAEKLGFNVNITAKSYTIPGLCDAILKHFLG